MGIFADECVIAALAVRELVAQLRLERYRAVFFLGIKYEDSPQRTDPPDQLMRLLDDLPVTLVRNSLAEAVKPAAFGAPTHRDRQTGAAGYLMGVSIQWYRSNMDYAEVGAGVTFGGLAGRSITALAARREGAWALESMGFLMS